MGFFLAGNCCNDCDMKSDGFIETTLVLMSILNIESTVLSLETVSEILKTDLIFLSSGMYSIGPSFDISVPSIDLRKFDFKFLDLLAGDAVFGVGTISMSTTLG